MLEEDGQGSIPNGPCLLLRHLATDGLLMTLTESGVQKTIIERDATKVQRLRTLEKVLADFLEKRTAKYQQMENPEQIVATTVQTVPKAEARPVNKPAEDDPGWLGNDPPADAPQ